MVIILVGVGVWLALNSKKVESLKSKSEDQKQEIKPTESAVKVAIMADVHNDTETLKKALEQAKKEGVTMVIVNGDMTINGQTKELAAVRAVLDESGIKYAVVPGNHDWWGKAGTYTAVFGIGYGVLRVDDAKYILINNSDGKGLGDRQWAWLANELGECWVVTCAAVAHEPLNHHFSVHVMGEKNNKVAAEAGKLLELLVKNNVGKLYSGHLHYASSYNLGGMETILVGAISSSRNTQTPRWTMVEGGEERVVEVVE